MKKKEAKIILLLIIVLIISIILIFINYLSLKKGDTTITDSTKTTTKLEVITTDISNDIFNHETIKTGENYSKATDDDRKLYEIKDIKKKALDKYTIIKGNVKNKNGKENIVIKLECLDDAGNVVSSSSIEVKNIKNGTTKEFEIKMMNNVFNDNYKVVIDFVGDK